MKATGDLSTMLAQGLTPAQELVYRALRANGNEVAARDVFALARAQGFNEQRMRRARVALGVKARRVGFGPGSFVVWFDDKPKRSIIGLNA